MPRTLAAQRRSETYGRSRPAVILEPDLPVEILRHKSMGMQYICIMTSFSATTTTIQAFSPAWTLRAPRTHLSLLAGAAIRREKVISRVTSLVMELNTTERTSLPIMVRRCPLATERQSLARPRKLRMRTSIIPVVCPSRWIQNQAGRHHLMSRTSTQSDAMVSSNMFTRFQEYVSGETRSFLMTSGTSPITPTITITDPMQRVIRIASNHHGRREAPPHRPGHLICSGILTWVHLGPTRE